MDAQMKRTWAEVDFDKLAHNYHALRGLAPAGTKYLGLVKADAYGHGAVPVAKKLEELGADYLGVACLDEAIEVREAGVKTPILILDEPTNHLDMESITALNNGLIKFPGVILFTSHDHQFVQTTANRIMEILPNGKLVDKITTYDEYLASDEMAKKRHVFQVNEEDAQDN